MRTIADVVDHQPLARPAGEPAPVRPAPPPAPAEQDDEVASTGARRRSWARLLRRIYEVDPFVCPRCGGELKIVAVITDPVVVDRILEHRKRRGLKSPFEPRAPPAA